MNRDKFIDNQVTMLTVLVVIFAISLLVYSFREVFYVVLFLWFVRSVFGLFRLHSSRRQDRDLHQVSLILAALASSPGRWAYSDELLASTGIKQRHGRQLILNLIRSNSVWAYHVPLEPPRLCINLLDSGLVLLHDLTRYEATVLPPAPA